MEITAFLMVGHPEETIEDFEQTLELVKRNNFDYATCSQTIPYPGTLLFEQYRDKIDFSLYPYRNHWKDAQREHELLEWEKRLYRAMYFRPSYMLKHAGKLLQHPIEMLNGVTALTRYLFNGRSQEAARTDLI